MLPIPGIYEIVHVSGRRYIGSSDNVKRRLEAHRRLLRRGRHDNIHLQRAWNRDGAAAFVFRMREPWPAETIREREADVLASLSRSECYNVSSVVRHSARAPNSALSDDAVMALWQRAKAGRRTAELAEEFGISIHTARRITSGYTYTRITGGRARGPHRARGTRVTLAKLNEETVRSIRRRLAAGEQGAAIAREVGVTPAAIYAIRNRATWCHLSDDAPSSRVS